MDSRSGHGRTHRRALAFTVVGIALLLGLAGCSSAGSSYSGRAKNVAPAGEPGAVAIDKQNAAGQDSVARQDAPAEPANAAADKAKAATELQAGGGTAAGSTAGGNGVAQTGAGTPQRVASERAIIYTGTMTVTVTEPKGDGAAAKVATLATGSGGYVGDDQRSSNGNYSTAALTVRVPVKSFHRVVDAIGALGKEKNRQISAEDVTAKLVDVTARLKTQQASVDRIRALMTQAKSITDVTTLEGELSRREADLESLEAQQRDLTNLTAMSTITVTLVTEGAPAPAPKKADNGFIAGLKSGWHAFAASCRAVLTVLGALLPFAVVIGVLAWLVLYLMRRRRATRRDGAAPQPPAQLPAQVPTEVPAQVPAQPQRAAEPAQK
jgi:hypothetical protein